jgi:hypothetical protein
MPDIERFGEKDKKLTAAKAAALIYFITQNKFTAKLFDAN